MVGFALGWEARPHGTLRITGDTVLYDGVRQVADRLQVDTALLHLGCLRFPVTGPGALQHDRPGGRPAVPPGPPPHRHPRPLRRLDHFRQGRRAIKQQFEQAPADIGRRLQWLPIGASVSIAG